MNVLHLHDRTSRASEIEMFDYDHLFLRADAASKVQAERTGLLLIAAWQQGVDGYRLNRRESLARERILRVVFELRRRFEDLRSVAWLSRFDFEAWRASEFAPSKHRSLNGEALARKKACFSGLFESTYSNEKDSVAVDAKNILRRVRAPYERDEELFETVVRVVRSQVAKDLDTLYEAHLAETGVPFANTRAPYYCQVAQIIEAIGLRRALDELPSDLSENVLRAWARIAARVPADTTHTGKALARLLGIVIPGRCCLVSHDALIRYRLFPFMIGRAIKISRREVATEVFYATLNKEDRLTACCNANGKNIREFFKAFERLSSEIVGRLSVGNAIWIAGTSDDGRSSFALVDTGDRYVVVGATAASREASEALVSFVLDESLVSIEKRLSVPADVVTLYKDQASWRASKKRDRYTRR